MLIADEIQTLARQDGIRLSCVLRAPRLSSLDGQQLWIDYPIEYADAVREPANAVLAATLMIAMAVRQPLHIASPVSERLLQGARTFARIMHTWRPELDEVDISTDGTLIDPAVGAKVASFFSGGVDSFYTLLKREGRSDTDDETISHLLFIRGYDLSLDRDHQLYAATLEGVSDIAARLRKALIPVASNIRAVQMPFVPWDFSHGTALVSVALGLSGLLKRVHVPSRGHALQDSLPWGSHPRTDPLWSTESLEVVHDGSEATRLQKVQQIAQSDIALTHLRVCYENRRGKYNCGRCGKCVRTMVNLEVAGALARCQTFRQPLRLRDVARLVLQKENDRAFMRENYEALSASGANVPLQRALARCLGRKRSVITEARSISLRFRRWIRSAVMAADRLLLRSTIKRAYRAWLRP